MTTHGFAIIGCGAISEVHARAIAEMPNARLVAAAEPVPERRAAFAERHRCAAHADYREMVRRSDVDVVCICTPSGAHLEPALAAAQAGKHVVCEKPIEVTLSRVDALLAACAAHDVRLCAIFPSRFPKAAQLLKEAVASGRFGRLTLGDLHNKWWRSQEYYGQGGWRGTWRLDGGGAVMNQGIHGVDLLQWYMGPVDSVFALTGKLAHPGIEVEDTAVATVRYRNGALGVIECATSTYPGLSRRIEIHGSAGTVVMDGFDFVTWEFADEQAGDAQIREEFRPGRARQRAGAADPKAIDHVNHRWQLEDFLAAIESGRAPFVDGREGRNAIEIVLALYVSARTGRPVSLPLGAEA